MSGKPFSPERRRARFFERLRDSGGYQPGACIEWVAATDGRGYGCLGVLGRKKMKAHQFAFVEFRGPVPSGFELDHLCRNTACANHNHLEAVTHRENVLRGNSLAAACARAESCPNGHPYSGDNLIVLAGYRSCRACHNVRSRRANQNYYARHRVKILASQREARCRRLGLSV